MPGIRDCPEDCFQGSTEFYDGPVTDEFTPSYLEARPLKDNVGTRQDGSIPPWITPGSPKSPTEQYIEWFNGIWHTGDPSTWNASVFTNLAVMIDPSGISKGAEQAAAGFLLIFKYFPELRGEVVSWAANEREILINWRFKIQAKRNQTPLLVPVVDKFCFVDGRVSFRLASFDIITFIGYLSENYGIDQLTNFLTANFWQAQKTGGIQLLPRMLWNLFKGVFFWELPISPLGLRVTPSDGMVKLEWEPVAGAISYTVNRAAAVGGPYEPPPFFPLNSPPQTNSYEDWSVTNGTVYWYLVSANFKKWEPVAVKKRAVSAEQSEVSEKQRPQLPWGVSRGAQVETALADRQTSLADFESQAKE